MLCLSNRAAKVPPRFVKSLREILLPELSPHNDFRTVRELLLDVVLGPNVWSLGFTLLPTTWFRRLSLLPISLAENVYSSPAYFAYFAYLAWTWLLLIDCFDKGLV